MGIEPTEPAFRQIPLDLKLAPHPATICLYRDHVHVFQQLRPSTITLSIYGLLDRFPMATLATTHRIQKINKELLQPIPALIELLVVHAGTPTQAVRNSQYLT